MAPSQTSFGPILKSPVTKALIAIFVGYLAAFEANDWIQWLYWNGVMERMGPLPWEVQTMVSTMFWAHLLTLVSFGPLGIFLGTQITSLSKSGHRVFARLLLALVLTGYTVFFCGFFLSGFLEIESLRFLKAAWLWQHLWVALGFLVSRPHVLRRLGVFCRNSESTGPVLSRQ